ncbi:MAG: hypothetical protein ACKN9T_14360 [Candidatus Methylumidiphilus sp.]
MTQTHTYMHRASRWLIAAGCALALNMANAALPTGEEVLARVGVPQDQIADLESGKAISWQFKENSEKELADGIAVYVAAPLAKVVGYIKKGNFAGLDTTLVAKGEIPDGATVAAFKAFSLSAEEAQDLQEVEAGDKFNLSAEEIASFASLKGADKNAVTQRYREILLQRYQAYRQSGLAGVAQYARDGAPADPAAELRTATERGSELIKSYSADLYEVWLNYPQALPADVSERFFWQSRNVEDRPTAALGHRLTRIADDGALVLQRQYYVGHSYNSSQFVVGALPYHDGALVFYALRSSTDQVAGMGSGMKHSIGRDRMKAEMVKQLQRLRATLK